MKRITLLITTIFLFVGCGNYMTEVWVNEDQSGKTKISIDAGEMIDMFGMALQEMGDQEDGAETEKLSESDSFFGEGKIDSTMVMYDMTPDSIKQKMENPELLKNMIMEMKGDADKREMIVSMSILYDSPEELAGLFSQMAAMQDGSQMGGAMSQEDMRKMFDNQKVDHKNGVVRIKMQNALQDMEEKGLFDEEMMLQLDSLRLLVNELGEAGDSEKVDMGELEFVKQLLDADLKSVYYLPGKVEFTNDRDAVLNGNTVTFSDNIWDVLMAGQDINMADRIIKYKVK